MTAKTSAAALLDELQQALVRRDVRVGFALLNRTFSKDARLDFTAPYSIRLLLSLAQWVDLGYRDTHLSRQPSRGFSPTQQAQLPTLDFNRFRMTEAYRHLADERLEACVDQLDLVLRMGEDLLGDYLSSSHTSGQAVPTASVAIMSRPTIISRWPGGSRARQSAKARRRNQDPSKLVRLPERGQAARVPPAR